MRPGGLLQAAVRHAYIDGLVQDCSNSSALAMELLQSCTKPSNFALANSQWSARCPESRVLPYNVRHQTFWPRGAGVVRVEGWCKFQ